MALFFQSLKRLLTVKNELVQPRGISENSCQANKVPDEVEFDPNEHIEFYFSNGNDLASRGHYEEALKSYQKVIGLNPEHSDAFVNCGNVLRALGRIDEAINAFQKAIEINPAGYLGYLNLGSMYCFVGNYEQAIYFSGLAIKGNPESIEPIQCRANALYETRRYEEAIQDYQLVLSLSPDSAYCLGMLSMCKQFVCDWKDFDVINRRAEDLIGINIAGIPPFASLITNGSAAFQKRIAEVTACTLNRANHENVFNYQSHEKIRVGYFSQNLNNHPVAYLISELFELHDRERFEITAFSLGHYDEYTKRIEEACYDFVDIRHMSDAEVVDLCRLLEIDIAVDLGGFTQGARVSLFAARIAPLQVSYLGYPGPMGRDLMDYLIADPIIIPKELRHHYSENISYIPHYQINSVGRQISDKLFTREELGLPANSFVYCCFNSPFKFTPETFDRWMKVLARVDGSVLYLQATSDATKENLRIEATLRDIDPDRLIFGARLEPSEYLARYRIADLFLDTLPYNAGTTASDALWVGLPVVTLVGEAFVSRMAASILSSIGLEELITYTGQEFVDLAVSLGTDQQRLDRVKETLRNNRSASPLFDSKLCASNIEAVFENMYRQYKSGQRYEDINVSHQVTAKALSNEVGT